MIRRAAMIDLIVLFDNTTNFLLNNVVDSSQTINNVIFSIRK